MCIMPTTGDLQDVLICESPADDAASNADEASSSSSEEVEMGFPSDYANGNGVKKFDGFARKASFQSCPMQEQHEGFIREAVEILLKNAIFDGTSR